jgi:hypothetical protein
MEFLQLMSLVDWDITVVGILHKIPMAICWFASYGGGVSKFDEIHCFKQGLHANKTRKVFLIKNKMYVGTEQNYFNH